MGSLFTVALCLITVFSIVSCASTTRAVATDNVIQRAPEGDFRNNYSKEASRQYVRERY